MEKRQTPIQSAIKFMNFNWTDEEIKKSNWLSSVYQELEWQLAKEKKLLEKVWDVGSESAYRNVRPDGPCEFDVKTHQADKTTFFSQFDK